MTTRNTKKKTTTPPTDSAPPSPPPSAAAKVDFGFDPKVVAALGELRGVKKLEELALLLKHLQPALALYVSEVQEPKQTSSITQTELKDLYGLACQYEEGLVEVGYDETHRRDFRDAIIAFFSIDELFGKKLRDKDFKTEPVEQVINKSKPWRNKLQRKGSQALFFDPARVAIYNDTNQSGTIEEEVDDLRTLVAAAKQDQVKLEAAGFSAQDILEGERLLAEAEGRDVLAILGIRSQADMKFLRDKHLTLAVRLALYTRASGRSAFWNHEDISEKFEQASFRDALRRLKPRRTGQSKEEEPEPIPEPEPTPEPTP